MNSKCKDCKIGNILIAQVKGSEICRHMNCISKDSQAWSHLKSA